MNIEVIAVAENQKSVLRQMLELYEYEFSRFNDNDLNEHGFYGYRYFDHYWTEPDRHAFFVKVDGKYAGFAMVNDYCYVLPGKGWSMAEFFILLKYRRLGVGKAAAVQIFDRFPGDWEVLQHNKNHDSQFFWKQVVEDYTHQDYEVKAARTEDWEGQAFVFSSRKGIG